MSEVEDWVLTVRIVVTKGALTATVRQEGHFNDCMFEFFEKIFKKMIIGGKAWE